MDFAEPSVLEEVVLVSTLGLKVVMWESTMKAVVNSLPIYSVRSIGPTTTNPHTFRKLLSDNSTWALIDRGPVEGYIPVWELLKDLGSEYETAADILEKIWQCDERKKKYRKIAKDELLLMKEDFFATVRMAKL